MRRVGMTPDIRGLTANDYSKIMNDEEIEKLVSKVMGDEVLLDKIASTDL
jgi:hypothetical protein